MLSACAPELREYRCGRPSLTRLLQTEDTTLNLESIGWNSHFARAFARQASEGQRPGRIAAFLGSECEVWTSGGALRAPLAGALRQEPGGAPVTGDWILLRADADVVCEILPRKTQLMRAVEARSEPQLLAANIDTLLIVTGLDGDFSPRRIERYLVLAAESGIDPIVVLSKADLCDAGRLEEAIAQVREAAPEVPVIPWSAVNGQDPGVIGGLLGKGQTAAVAGSSGAGKSTLINRLLGEHRQETKEVRQDDSRGRHATTRRELIMLPHKWVIADLPGLRAVGLWASAGSVAAVFQEVNQLSRRCRYRDCTHSGEPGCVVRIAVESGDLAPARAASFGKLSREAGFSSEAKKRWEKTIAKAIRNRTKMGFDPKR